MKGKRGNHHANEEVDRRAEILNAAVELFGTLGYYGTSLQKIADRVGLTKLAYCIMSAVRKDCSQPRWTKSTIPKRKTFLPTWYVSHDR